MYNRPLYFVMCYLVFLATHVVKSLTRVCYVLNATARDAPSGTAVVCRCAAELAKSYVTLLRPEFVPVWGKQRD
jgi:hypothetical protein